LLDRLAPLGAELLVDTVDALAAGGLEAIAQPGDGATLAPRLSVDDARIDWQRAAIDIDRSIRACTPAPGAWTTFGGERLRIGVPVAVAARSPNERSTPGSIHLEGRRVIIVAGSGHLEIDQVQPPGKKWMAADAWIRGLRTGDLHVH
jgi:methionyl-tRNA formyltransferase